MTATLAAYLHTIDPYAIMLWEGGPIRWYGLSYLLGFFIAYHLIKRVARTGGSTLKPTEAGDLIVSLAIGIVLGGRLGYVLFYRPELLTETLDGPPYWAVLAINQGGMASHGGMIGGILACGWFAWRRGHCWPHLLDLAAFAAPLGLMFGRVANFINGELLGRPCDPALPWAVKFPQELFEWDSQQLTLLWPAIEALPPAAGQDPGWVMGRVPSVIAEVQAGNVEVTSLVEPLLTARHPSQLYAAALEGLILFLLLTFIWRRPRKPGVISGWFCVLYGLLRIGGEHYRMPDAHIGFQWLGMTRGQWLSVGLLIGGMALLAAFGRRGVPCMGGWRATSTGPAKTHE